MGNGIGVKIKFYKKNLNSEVGESAYAWMSLGVGYMSAALIFIKGNYFFDRSLAPGRGYQRILCTHFTTHF
jgi:hypothetical protein